MSEVIVHDLGDLTCANDEEIAEVVVNTLRDTGVNYKSFLYRGLVCSPEKLQVILANGTDRSLSGWEEAARKWHQSNRDSLEGMTMKKALRDTDPRFTWAAEYFDIVNAVGCADEPRPNGCFSAILAYDSEFLQQHTPAEQYYKFLVKPLDALRFIFRYL